MEELDMLEEWGQAEKQAEKELEEEWERIRKEKEQIERKINIMLVMLGIQVVTLFTQVLVIIMKIKMQQ